MFRAYPRTSPVPHVPLCLAPSLAFLHAQHTLCVLCGPAGAPVCSFSALPPVLTYPLRYPIASPAAKHLLLGENLLLGNRFLKQQLWLCYSLNFTSPARNNEPVWSGVHLCTCNSLGNDRPLPTRCACLLVPYSSQPRMQKGSKLKFFFKTC